MQNVIAPAAWQGYYPPVARRNRSPSAAPGRKRSAPPGDGPSPHEDDTDAGGTTLAERASSVRERQLLRDFDLEALRRIGSQVAEAVLEPGRPRSRQSDEVRRQLALAARVRDVVFGLTRPLGPFGARLQAMTEAQTELSSNQDQVLRANVTCDGDCPPELDMTVLLTTQKLIDHAVQTGFYARIAGRISVGFKRLRGGLCLTVADDGWSCAFRQCDLRRLTTLQAMVAPVGGRITFSSTNGFIAALILPGIG